MPVVTISKISEQTKTSAKGKKYKVVTVEGTKYGSGEPWSTDIFKNKTELLDALDEFGTGEMVNFQFKKNGRFYDLVDISEPTEENLEFAKSYDANKSSNAGSVGGPKKWDGRTGEQWNRSAAVYLAFDMIKSTLTEAALRKMSPEELMGETFRFAECLFNYVEHGDLGQNTESTGDALDPPID
jgi:hypothetical protein